MGAIFHRKMGRNNQDFAKCYHDLSKNIDLRRKSKVMGKYLQ